jgi:hypothetical protein
VINRELWSSGDTYSLLITVGPPSIDSDGELLATDEPAIFEHYGLQYQPGAGGERRLARR